MFPSEPCGLRRSCRVPPPVHSAYYTDLGLAAAAAARSRTSAGADCCSNAVLRVWVIASGCSSTHCTACSTSTYIRCRWLCFLCAGLHHQGRVVHTVTQPRAIPHAPSRSPIVCMRFVPCAVRYCTPLRCALETCCPLTAHDARLQTTVKS